MTAPSAVKLQREQEKELWLLDSEIFRRMGVPEKAGREAFRVLDKDLRSGFPQQQKLWGGRRYWPAVKAFFDRKYGMINDRRG